MFYLFFVRSQFDQLSVTQSVSWMCSLELASSLFLLPQYFLLRVVFINLLPLEVSTVQVYCTYWLALKSAEQRHFIYFRCLLFYFHLAFHIATSKSEDSFKRFISEP